MGIEVVAEGVETRHQAEFLIGEGCYQAQGFCYGHPLPAEEFEKVLDAALARFGDDALVAAATGDADAPSSDDAAPVA